MGIASGSAFSGSITKSYKVGGGENIDYEEVKIIEICREVYLFGKEVVRGYNEEGPKKQSSCCGYV